MGSSGSWGQWIASCPTDIITIGRYPIPLPEGVSIPSWAYYDFTTSGVFNAVVGPESSAIPAATGPPVSASVPSPTITRTVPTDTENNEGSSTSRPVKNQSETASSNTGAIAGGVVGGILGIGLIALVAFVLTRKRKSEDSATDFLGDNHRSPMTTQFNSPNQPVSTPEYKSYNPSDPSGPATPAVESIAYSYQPQGATGQQPYPTPRQV
ncbi:transmembrane protein, putative [Rhizoctonia solani AG-3 Rhs1AP]|uniref:Transmembrane protein, putative n=1 Tax=Rhizoctonia solani AG-3 Rhs1AP TaxID=1086054 RepID=X8J3V4_9AGAM|nr:transmembrane protein, putative [Rhizoctonia solani AG-3 Rhs1AP]